MRETLEAPGVAGLERSGSRPPVWVHLGAGGPGLERAEISLSAWAYQPHQHDTYGIGITLTGVQAFRYRGERWVCLPGQLHILHPGETHDGAAATGLGLRYRIVYLAPELVRGALGGRRLPFVAGPVQRLTPATRRIARFLAYIDEPVSELQHTEIAVTVAASIWPPTRRSRSRPPPWRRSPESTGSP